MITAMHPTRHDHDLSAADAESRLRYVQDVRRRTHRVTAVSPVLLVGVLGALVIVRGMLLLYWPHVAGLSAAWYIGVSLGGVAAAIWLENCQRMRTGIQAARARPALFVATIAAEFVAHAIGANVIIVGIGVPLALAAWRTGNRTSAAAIVAIGLISEALVLQGTRQWAALVIFGAGLVAVGIAGRQPTRATA